MATAELAHVDESLIFTLLPAEVKIKEDLPRTRKEMGEIEKLAESIKSKGQIQPIVLNRNGELIAGGRRLAACFLLDIAVRCCYKDTVDPLIMKEMEIEENVQRKQFTPAEEVMAIKELHDLKRTLYGEAQSGKEGGWTVEKTAEVVGKSRTSVIEDLALAQALECFPDLKDCKTKSDIKKAVKSAELINRKMDAIVSYEEAVKKLDIIDVRLQDAKIFMGELEDESVDLLLTDPLYGIQHHEIGIGLGGETGGHSSTGIKVEDDKDNALDLVKSLAEQSARFCKPNAHAWVFVGPEHFAVVKMLFEINGWLVHVKPLIWCKRESGQNNAPHAWPSSCYEMFMYARKPESRLVAEGRPDWIQCDPVKLSERVHPYEKPVTLLKELISRTVLPSAVMVDPFMGSGASIEAGLDMKLIVKGCDIAPESYATTLERIKKWKEKNS